jgi:alanine dehydrogenase
MKSQPLKNNVVHYCVLILLRVIQKLLHWVSVIFFLLLMQIAEDGGLESAIRCDIGLKVRVFLSWYPDE